MPFNFSVIRTRITPPRRRGELVTRPRLIELLNELIDKRLVLISAPAGYGKTSLMVDFAGHCTLPVCWFTLDSLDFDPQRFITYFIAAIRHRFPSFGERSTAVLAGEQGKLNIDFLANTIVNDLYENVTEHFILILDDFHLVNESQPVRNFISRFLQDAEENVHIIMTSRSLLSLPILPSLAAHSDVAGFNFEELSFQADEIQKLYKQNRNQTIDMDIARSIQDRTEGWITGIILTSQVSESEIRARSRLERLTGFSIDEYFLQIIDNLNPELRSFLLWSSLLEEFNASHCDLVLGTALNMPDAPWQQWMETILQNNLFVLPVGDQGDWLRYHPIFLDFLQTRVFQEYSMSAEKIERQLAGIHLEYHEWDQAFSIYHRLNSQEDLLGLIETAGPEVLGVGRITTLSAWIDVIPEDVAALHPIISALRGKIAFSTGDTIQAMAFYNQAVNQMESLENSAQLALTLIWRANLNRLMGNLDPAISDANRCLNLINSSPEMQRINGDALRCIGLCIYHQGKLQEALTWLQNAYEVTRSIGDPKNEAEIQMEMGIIYEHIGQYARAKNSYLSALDYWNQAEDQINQSILLNNLGVLLQMMGDYEQACLSFKQALDYSRSSGYTRIEAYILTGIGDMYAELQADDQAMEAYKMALKIANHVHEHFLQVYIHTRSAALAGLQGELHSGYELIHQAEKLIKPDGSEMEHQLCALELAGLKIWDGKSAEAIPLLENACAFFGREGHKIQYDRANLYAILAYHACGQPQKIIEHILLIRAAANSEYPPFALIALGTRLRKSLDIIKIEHLHEEINFIRKNVGVFEETLPALRRFVRENNQIVPFAPPVLYIQALGRMQVKLNDHQITSSEWQTTAARDLFFMLLAHPEGMTKEEISLLFWPDASNDEARFRFKNTIYRLRRAVGKNTILLDQEIYRFNNRLDYEYDVELFLKEYALAAQSNDPHKKLSHYREALKVYRGNYLADVNETWALNPRQYLRQNFLRTLLDAAQICFDLNRYEIALEYCQRALNEDNLLEEAYQLALKIFAATGNRVGLIRQYKLCVEVLEREINAPPSAETRALYEELLH